MAFNKAELDAFLVDLKAVCLKHRMDIDFDAVDDCMFVDSAGSMFVERFIERLREETIGQGVIE